MKFLTSGKKKVIKQRKCIQQLFGLEVKNIYVVIIVMESK